MAWAISNSSTLLNLAIIGRLSLLREFHEKIIVPPAVWREVVTEGRGRAGAAEVEAARQSGWIDVIPPQDREVLKLLKRDLDDGESEAIALAKETL
jgi:predicted nucleic acid-binding protein